MIKIITPGKTLKEPTILKFACLDCGCVFEADESEYEFEKDGCRITAYCTCPCCCKVAFKIPTKPLNLI